MEVVTLNERLRGDFSALLKLLPPPYAVSVLSTLKRSIYSSPSPVPTPSTDRYTKHCRQILWRLNSYQYGSASAFLLDLEQLERVAGSSEVKKQVQVLLNRLAVSEGEKQVVCIDSENEEMETNAAWLCNVSLRDQIVTVGTFKTREEALQGYEEQRKLMAENAGGFNNLRQLAAKVEAEQREDDRRVLKEALAQCHPRLTTMKVTLVAPHPVTAVSGTCRYWSVASENIKRFEEAESGRFDINGEEAEDGSESIKLRHLKGKEVCVLSSPDFGDETRLRASGRLEAGKVFSFHKKKQMTFADYVRDELGRPESACAHMFLVRSRESIDDHLKVCDAFSDNERELGRRPQPGRSKKASRRR
ncbi:hypothetical protein PHMEG_00024581 [Phytophthora megakarya]|uniref:Uncharacterized protein n=1 Tax=Phytophthora megakarya TaxID=4795 RepID=A0A225VFK9_9STRA|nr:hypothetical protein PHMEG_00024581 [Phytophthora megakarya]